MTTTPRTDQRLERGQRTRERLVEEGLRLFALKGFDAVSTRELSQASGANIAAIHFHFGGKAGLYEAVIGDVAGRLARIYAEATDAGVSPGDAQDGGQAAPPTSTGPGVAPGERLGPTAPSATGADGEDSRLARAMIERMVVSLLSSKRSRWMTLLLQREFINPTEGFASIFETALRPVLEAMAASVEAVSGKPRGGFDNKTLAFSLFVLVSAFSRNRTLFLRWTAQDDYAPDDPARIGALLAGLALDGLAGGQGRAPVTDNTNHNDGPAS